jgi:hypothetical protein
MLSASTVLGQAHGPTFSVATPTLGQGDISSNTSAMVIGTDSGTSFMSRQMFGYGLNQRLQANIAVPISPVIGSIQRPPRTRFGAMMNGGMFDAEGILQWRFFKKALGVGERIEATVSINGTAPLTTERGGLGLGPSTGATVAAGYASRSVYGWIGGGYSHYFERNDDRIGDLPFVSAAFAWRPAFIRNNPIHDWRIFVEGLGEFPGPAKVAGSIESERGTRVSVGPTLLGLYGAWGITISGLVPLYRSQSLVKHRNEELAFIGKTVITYWF